MPHGPTSAPDADRPDRFGSQVLPEVEVLLRVATRMTGDPVDAEDLVQEVLLRAHRGIHTFDGRHPRAWLLTIMRNTWASMNRRRRVHIADDPDGIRLAAAEAVDGDSDPESQVMDRMLEGPLADALLALSPAHREIVLLVDAEGLSYAEAASLLGVPEGTVMSRLHRARRNLRTRIDRASLFAGTGTARRGETGTAG